MKISFLLILLILELSSFSQEYFVIAPNGLSVRDHPSLNSKRKEALHFLHKINLVQKTGKNESITDNGKKVTGEWYEISYDNGSGEYMYGYMFSYFLKEKKNYLRMPDEKMIVRLREDSQYKNSMMYQYLVTHYDKEGERVNSKISSLQKDYVCSFRQGFTNSILYFKNECGEVGSTEKVEFPYIDIETIHKLIEEIDGNTGQSGKNVWFNPFKYSPPDQGAGCYYEIKPSKQKVQILVSCGC